MWVLSIYLVALNDFSALILLSRFIYAMQVLELSHLLSCLIPATEINPVICTVTPLGKFF